MIYKICIRVFNMNLPATGVVASKRNQQIVCAEGEVHHDKNGFKRIELSFPILEVVTHRCQQMSSHDTSGIINQIGTDSSSVTGGEVSVYTSPPPRFYSPLTKFGCLILLSVKQILLGWLSLVYI